MASNAETLLKRAVTDALKEIARTGKEKMDQETMQAFEQEAHNKQGDNQKGGWSEALGSAYQQTADKDVAVAGNSFSVEVGLPDDVDARTKTIYGIITQGNNPPIYTKPGEPTWNFGMTEFAVHTPAGKMPRRVPLNWEVSNGRSGLQDNAKNELETPARDILDENISAVLKFIKII